MGRGNPSPDELNNFKEHKLTRRRVMNLASAIGFSTPVAMNMTVDDVKASDSDEVTVSWDVSGNTKYTVAADRVEWLQRAKKVNEEIKDEYFDSRGILGVGMSGGDGEDNPHVVVSLDKDDEESSERRGELPEQKDGIRIETQEREREGETTCEPDCVSENEHFPGGQDINPEFDGSCTNSSRMWEDGLDWFGWTTAAHCFPNCSSSDVTVYHDASGCFYEIGKGDFVDITRDIAFIEFTEQRTSPWNLKPSDHTEGVEIIDTITDEGFGIVDEEGLTIYNYGIGSCFQDYDLRRWNEQTSYDSYECHDSLYDQMITEHNELGGTAESGDSGSLWFIEDHNNSGNYYAMESISGYYMTLTNGWEHTGPQGFTIHDIYGRAWRN